MNFSKKNYALIKTTISDMSKKLLLVTAIVVLGFTVNAQGTRFGVKAGANFSTVTGGDVTDASSRSGINIGAAINIGLTKKFAIQPEITYSNRGWEDGNFTITANYIDVAAMLDFEITSGLSLQAGPIINLNILAESENNGSLAQATHLGSEVGTKGGDLNITRAGGTQLKMAEITEIKQVPIGIGVGAQYELESGLFFNVRYDKAFSEVIFAFDAKGSNFSVSLGYFF